MPRIVSPSRTLALAGCRGPRSPLTRRARGRSSRPPTETASRVQVRRRANALSALVATADRVTRRSYTTNSMNHFAPRARPVACASSKRFKRELFVASSHRTPINKGSDATHVNSRCMKYLQARNF